MNNFGQSKQKLVAIFQNLIKKYRLQVLKDVFLFMVITLVIHFLWRFWANNLGYDPFAASMHEIQEWMATIVFNQSTWFITNVLGIPITTVENTMYFANKGYMQINQSCSGMKQIMQFVLLMMVFPGLWKRKLWFIPLGVLIVHLTNLFRVIGLSVVITTIPDYWKFSHDNVFRPLFYIVIFAMWVWWVEKIGHKKTRKIESGL